MELLNQCVKIYNILGNIPVKLASFIGCIYFGKKKKDLVDTTHSINPTLFILM